MNFQLHEPTHVAEVLTMRQVRIFGEHTVGNLEASGILQLVLSLEGIESTLFLHYLERFNRVNMLLTVGRSISRHQFEPNGIVQAFLVDNVSNGIFLTALDRTFDEFFGLLPVQAPRARPDTRIATSGPHMRKPQPDGRDRIFSPTPGYPGMT